MRADDRHEHHRVGRAPGCWSRPWTSSRDPGIAPSRLNAKVIREALVMQAVVQNNWPAAEISRTRKCQPCGERLAEDHVDAAAARC